jgi:leucyl/phenylalanyl-tRNA--protein transferase
MALTRFPDPRYADTNEGILAVGGDLTPESLLEAYQHGIFPWPIDDYPLTWFCPEERAILDFADLHLPRSLIKARKRSQLHFTIDRAFPAVIHYCSTVPRSGQDGTWITPAMLNAYCEFHKRGYAHSVEAWEGDLLVGAVYGVDSGGVFTGESMFHSQPYASKLALLFLIDHLKERGSDWIDIQVMTPHMEALGAKLIDRVDFLDRLAATQARRLSLFME